MADKGENFIFRPVYRKYRCRRAQDFGFVPRSPEYFAPTFLRCVWHSPWRCGTYNKQSDGGWYWFYTMEFCASVVLTKDISTLEAGHEYGVERN